MVIAVSYSGGRQSRISPLGLGTFALLHGGTPLWLCGGDLFRPVRSKQLVQGLHGMTPQDWVREGGYQQHDPTPSPLSSCF